MFSFLQNLSLLFSITRSSSFSVIYMSVNINNNVEKDTTFSCCVFFLKVRVVMRLFPNKTLSFIWVAIPVDWIILNWHACGADGRSVGVWSCFLGWVVYHIYLPMVLHCTRFARVSSAIKFLGRLYLICSFNDGIQEFFMCHGKVWSIYLFEIR